MHADPVASAHGVSAFVDGPTRQLCGWLASAHIDDVPAAVRLRAKHVLLDGIGCALVGAQLPWSRIAVNGVEKIDGQGDCTLIGWSRKMTAPSAALLNGTFIQAFELDDYHPIAPLHSASVVLPPLMAAAEQLHGVNGSRFLLGAILGFEVGPRVGMALHGHEMLSRGWHSGAVFGAQPAAVAAGTLFGLDAAGFEDALGMSATQSSGLMAAQFEAMCKRMQHGFAARNGLYAASLASASYTGIKSVFEREYGGFLSTFGEGHAPDPWAICDALGERWETERIAIKPYAAMAALHGTIEALIKMRESDGFDAALVRSIDIDVTDVAFKHGGWLARRPLTPTGAQMNLAYAAAVTILDGAALLPQFSPSRINDDDVWRLIEQTRIRLDDDFESLGRDSHFMTRVRVSFVDGSMKESVVAQPLGGLDRPLSNQDVLEKYRAMAGPIVPPDRVREIEELTLNLENQVDVHPLIELLGESVSPSFE